MPLFSRPLLAIAIALPVPFFLLQQHLRLLALYPTRRISPSLEISIRTDRPAKPGTEWLQPTAGDEWTADVPRRWLEAKDLDMAQVFASAFWGSWPLKLEKRIVMLLIRAGVGPFAFRSLENKDVEETGRFGLAERILGGLFLVEAHDKHPKFVQGVSEPARDGPIVVSWWLKDEQYDRTSTRRQLLGGYHSFAVESLSPSSPPTGEATVRLVFASHLIVSPPAPGPAISTTPSPPTDNILGFSMLQRCTMYFHQVYSRILLDLAVRRLRNQDGA